MQKGLIRMKKISIILCMCIGMLWCSCVSAGTIEYQDLIDEITNERAISVYNIDLNAPFEKEKILICLTKYV